MVDCRHREREAEVRHRVADRAEAQAAVAEAENIRAPSDDRAHRDRDEAARHAAEVAHAAEPIGQDHGEANDADQRRLEHQQAGPHRDEGDRDAGERAEQRRARRDAADDRRDEAAGHQDEALHEHPGEPSLPCLHRIFGLEQDRQHDDEGDDEHVRHADARGQRADVGAAGLLGEAIGEPGVIDRAEKQHQSEGGQDAAEHQRVRHLQHEAQQAGQHQNVDEDVRSESEEGVPVAGNPKALAARRCHCRGLHGSAPILRGFHSGVSLPPRRRSMFRTCPPSRRCRPGP